MSLSINYKLTGAGWAECTILDEERSCTITASYLADALGDMVVAANALLHWFNSVSFSFQEEPGEYRWEFIYMELSNDFELKISDCHYRYEKTDGSENRLLFQSVVTPEAFGKAVHEAATKVLVEYGEEGYFEKWVNHPFPMEGLNELTRHLARGSAT